MRLPDGIKVLRWV